MTNFRGLASDNFRFSCYNSTSKKHSRSNNFERRLRKLTLSCPWSHTLRKQSEYSSGRVFLIIIQFVKNHSFKFISNSTNYATSELPFVSVSYPMNKPESREKDFKFIFKLIMAFFRFEDVKNYIENIYMNI